MAKNMKDKQAQYDKCMAQSAQHKFHCPSKCLAHSLLQRLLKKLGEHHFLALLVEPKILEEPDVKVKKIIQAQKNHKLNAPQPQKRPLNVQNGYNNTTKKPRNSAIQYVPRPFISRNGFSSSRSSSTASISSLASHSSSLPSLRAIAPYPSSTTTNTVPPSSPAAVPSEKKFCTPCLVPQAREGIKKTSDCFLKIRNNGSCSYFTKVDLQKPMLSLPPRKYEISQCGIGLSKIAFNTQHNGTEYKLCLNLYRFSPIKKFKFFGMAFRDQYEARWRCTAQNELPDDKVVSVVIPLHNVHSRLAIFSVWFNNTPDFDSVKNSNPECMSAPIMVDLFSETGINYIATFEPEFVEID